jgi:hypothetical protein
MSYDVFLEGRKGKKKVHHDANGCQAIAYNILLSDTVSGPGLLSNGKKTTKHECSMFGLKISYTALLQFASFNVLSRLLLYATSWILRLSRVTMTIQLVVRKKNQIVRHTSVLFYTNFNYI